MHALRFLSLNSVYSFEFRFLSHIYYIVLDVFFFIIIVHPVSYYYANGMAAARLDAVMNAINLALSLLIVSNISHANKYKLFNNDKFSIAMPCDKFVDF